MQVSCTEVVPVAVAVTGGWRGDRRAEEVGLRTSNVPPAALVGVTVAGLPDRHLQRGDVRAADLRGVARVSSHRPLVIAGPRSSAGAGAHVVGGARSRAEVGFTPRGGRSTTSSSCQPDRVRAPAAASSARSRGAAVRCGVLGVPVEGGASASC